MRYLVTGAEGFIGGQFMEAMPDAIAVPPQRDLSVHSDDAIIHLGAVAGVGECLSNPRQAFLLNTESTVKLLESARDYGVRMVFASSSAAANPTNPYAASKASSEAWCRAYRESYMVPVSILRFANVYGPGSLHKTSCVASMCKGALEGKIVIHGHGAQERDFVYVGDVVKALADAPMGGEFSVRTSSFYQVGYVARFLADLSGAEIVSGDRPPGDVDKPSDAWTPFPMSYTKLDEGLERTWEWFKANA